MVLHGIEPQARGGNHCPQGVFSGFPETGIFPELENPLTRKTHINTPNVTMHEGDTLRMANSQVGVAILSQMPALTYDRTHPNIRKNSVLDALADAEETAHAWANLKGWGN